MSEPSGILSMPVDVDGRPRPEPAALSFTDYVRGLEPGGTPTPKVFAQLQQRLRGVLVLELKRRCLWYLCPRCLGIFGPATWQEPGAVEELVADCYVFVFLKRLSSLRAHLRIKANIDGLVFRSIHNYLYDRQKKHDPLGFRIFSILQSAIRRCCDDGRLHVLAGDERVRNDTVLGFDAGADSHQVQPMRGLSRRVATWNDDLLPELVTARGKKLERLIERLADHVLRLRDVGETFAFARVLEPLKDDARRRWSALGAQGEGRLGTDPDDGTSEPERQVLPDTRFEQHQAFEWLVHCVSLQIERLTDRPKTLDRLRRLWVFLRHQVTEGDDCKPVSRRRVASLLKIPRDSLPGLYSTLGRLTHGCQDTLPSDHLARSGD